MNVYKFQTSVFLNHGKSDLSPSYYQPYKMYGALKSAGKDV